jgi:hypothetical protein
MGSPRQKVEDAASESERGGNMDFKDWLEKYRVKGTRDGDGRDDLAAHGKFGYIGEYADGKLCMALLAVPRNKVMNGALNSRKADAKAGGMTPMQVAEHVYESIWAFDGDDARLSELAIELVRPRRRKVVVLTPERRAALVDRLAVMRQTRLAGQIAA